MGAPSPAVPRTEDPSPHSHIPILPPLLLPARHLWAALGQVHTQTQHPSLDPCLCDGLLRTSLTLSGCPGPPSPPPPVELSCLGLPVPSHYCPSPFDPSARLIRSDPHPCCTAAGVFFHLAEKNSLGLFVTHVPMGPPAVHPCAGLPKGTGTPSPASVEGLLPNPLSSLLSCAEKVKLSLGPTQSLFPSEPGLSASPCCCAVQQVSVSLPKKPQYLDFSEHRGAAGTAPTAWVPCPVGWQQLPGAPPSCYRGGNEHQRGRAVPKVIHLAGGVGGGGKGHSPCFHQSPSPNLAQSQPCSPTVSRRCLSHKFPGP